MPKLRFRTHYDAKGRPQLRHVKGPLDEGDAVDLGMLWYEPKKDDPEPVGYYYYEHPRNEEAVRRMKRVFKTRGYIAQVKVVDGRGDPADNLLLPDRPPTLQKRFVSVFGGDVTIAPQGTWDLADLLIDKHHPHLANAAILFVLEDFEPEDMGDKFGTQGEVWGFCQTLGGQFRKLTGFDFKITFCEGVWRLLPSRARRWLCDHEIMHCGRNDRGRWVLNDHDIQMFSEELTRYPHIEANVLKLNQIVAAKLLGEEQDRLDEEIEEAKPKKRKKKRKKRAEACYAPERLATAVPRGTYKRLPR